MSKRNTVEHLSDPEYLSAPECNAALEALCKDRDQVLRLHRAARFHASNDLEAEDLVQEAFLRILDGDRDRNWPRALAALQFVIQTVRSIASERRERRKRRKPHMTPTNDPPDDTLPCPNPTPAEMLETLHQDATTRAQTLKHFDDDPELQALTEAMLDGWEKNDLLSLFEHDETKYQTTRKRLRRKLNKLQAAPLQTGRHHDKKYVRETNNR